MKRGVILAFSRRGMETAGRIARALEGEYETECLRPEGNLRPLVEARFPVSDALIFVGSCGIAARAIAPFLKGKTRDPAVIVSDATSGAPTPWPCASPGPSGPSRSSPRPPT